MSSVAERYPYANDANARAIERLDEWAQPDFVECLHHLARVDARLGQLGVDRPLALLRELVEERRYREVS
jgi:hypothetical protein